MCNKYNELGEGPSHLSTRALEQVLREAIWVGKQSVVCKPAAYILAVSKEDAQGIIPENKMYAIHYKSRILVFKPLQ